jgi:tRNA (guanine37-N1)-methyltransferase
MSWSSRSDAPAVAAPPLRRDLNMRVDIVTLFPELIEPYVEGGLLQAARERGILEIHFHQLRDHTTDKHRQVDDRPYGGGPGMILKPEPFFRAVEAIQQQLPAPARIVLLSARGRLFTQALARQFAQERRLVLLCGRYQEIDERVTTLASDEISIGDYVLSGGELPALVITEAVCRLVPGVVGNQESLEMDSFAQQGLLGPPHYTRPADFRDLKVPEVLLSGDHAAIERWRLEQAREKTRKNRPELLAP